MADNRWPITTVVPNERELVLRVRYDSTRVPVSLLTDALGETMRDIDGCTVNSVGGEIIELRCADELSGPETGDFDWSFDKHEEN